MRAYRPDRVVRVLTSVVSIAYFGLLVMGIIVLIGLPTVKLTTGDGPEWMIGLTVPVASLDSDATVLTRWGDGRLEVEDMRGSLRLPLGTLPWWLFAVLWTYVAVTTALMLMFLHHLRRIFQRVRNGAPFDATNALRLRWLGLLALAFAGLRGVSESVTSLAVRGSLISDRVEVPPGLSVDGRVVFFGMVLLALAEIFRRGAALEEEQSLTV
jgi:hypothetical protein